MYEKRTRFGVSERTWLKDILPLETPLSIAFDPSSACNFRCSYCKNSVESYRRTTKVTPFSTFEALVANLDKCQTKVKALSLAREGEPLMNRDLPKMIRLAKQSGIFERVVTISNGALLTHELSDELADAGLDRILFSVQGLTAENYKSICGYSIDMDKFIENIGYLHRLNKCKVHIKGFYDTAYGTPEVFEKAFYDYYQSVCDEISIEHVIDIMKEVDYSSMAINDDIDRYGERAVPTKVCPTAFYTVQVLPSGDVGICCLNNDPCFIVGNIFRESVKDIFNNPKITGHRLLHLRGKRYQHEICKKCYFPDKFINPTDRIDDYAERLLEYYGCRLPKSTPPGISS